MTPNRSLFHDFPTLSIPRTIILGDNSSHQANGFGTVQIQLSTGQSIFIQNVLYVSGLAKNLLSVAQITTTGNTVLIFKKNQCIIKTKAPNTRVPMTYYIPQHDNLYSLGNGVELATSSYSATTSNPTDKETLKWHHCLGHLNIRSLSIMKNKDMVDGLPVIKSSLPLCDSCVLGKHPKSPYPTNPATRATEVLALIHTDLCSPMNTSSLGGTYYFLLFIDDFSRYTYVYFLIKKSQVLEHFIQYKNLVENQTSKKILFLRSDNGGEFTSTKFNNYCADSDIQRQFTNPYNPAQNRVSERKNRTLVTENNSRTRLFFISSNYNLLRQSILHRPQPESEIL
jgi:hypothetical protein